MQYMLPRLSTFLTEGAGLDAKGGGSSSGSGSQFLKGSGESQLEVDRRLFERSRIEGSLDELQAQRDAYEKRERSAVPVVAIVGYTNAGKSTLLNKLCGSSVYADDLLFATLDPTTRKLALPGGKEVLVSDTVGFIQKLPTKLVASFRATLDELSDASLVLHVVDAASPLGALQVRSVQGIVEEVDAQGIPQILVLNKADAVAADAAAAKLARDQVGGAARRGDARPGRRHLARDGRGLDRLLAGIEAGLLATCSRVDCVLPYACAALLAEVHKTGTIETEECGRRDTPRRLRPVARNRLEKACSKFESDVAAAAGAAAPGATK